MQEQHPYNITSEQGWQQMLPVLDKAMPVARRSRRVILFWWTAAAVATFGLVAIMSLLTYSPGNYQDTLSTRESVTPSTTETDSKTTSRESTHEPGLVTTEANIQEKSTPKEHKQGNKQIQIVTKNTSDAYASSSEGSHAQQADDNIHYAIGFPGVTEEINDLTELHQSGIADKTVDPLYVLPIESINRDIATVDIPLSQPVIILQQDQNQRELSAYVDAGSVMGIENGLGVHGGLGLEWALTSNLSVNAGIGYQTFNPDVAGLGSLGSGLFEDQNENLRLEDQEFGYYFPAEVVQNASGSVLKGLVDAINQWQFTTGLKYDLSDKFFIEGGMTIGFASKGKSVYPIVTAGYDPLVGDLFSAGKSLDQYDIIRRTTKSVYGGIGYKPGKHFELYAQWTHGLDSYLMPSIGTITSGSQNQEYARGINIGARYIL